MNFPLTFVVLLMVAMASAAPKPKTYLVETASDEVTFQLFECILFDGFVKAVKASLKKLICL